MGCMSRRRIKKKKETKKPIVEKEDKQPEKRKYKKRGENQKGK